MQLLGTLLETYNKIPPSSTCARDRLIMPGIRPPDAFNKSSFLPLPFPPSKKNIGSQIPQLNSREKCPIVFPFRWLSANREIFHGEIAGGERGGRARAHKGGTCAGWKYDGSDGIAVTSTDARSHENSIGSAAAVAVVASWNFPKFLTVIVTQP